MGIGEAIASSLAEQGANLILFARSEVSHLAGSSDIVVVKAQLRTFLA